MNGMKRFGAWMLALVLAVPCLGLAEGDEGLDEDVEESIEEQLDIGTDEETQEAAVTEKDGWHFDSRGFLAGDDNPGDEYLLEIGRAHV